MSIDIIQNIAFISTGLFLVYLILTLFGLEIDLGVDAGGVLSFFSFQGILIGFMTFSWGYLFFSQSFENTALILVLAIALCLGFMVLFKAMFKFLRKASTEFGIAEFKPEKGTHGIVYITVPPKKRSGGQVTFECNQLGTMQLDVLSQSDYPIPTGEKVIVEDIKLSDDGDTYTIYVKPLTERKDDNKIVF